ncbi:glycosyl transferase, group 1 [hydrocarbon metagenome]|uniref:Glycosyl transferase, group 1 n=1 Tax=hydrocarbon metagenome TaxID=938273 RepID=A0A0W8FLK7_9ZZZZ
MKILMLHGYYSGIGGAEVIINNQINGLRERGHEVLLFCFGNKNIDEKNLVVIKEPKSSFLRYFYQVLINPRGYLQLKKTIKSFKPDIIHLHNIDKHILTFLMPVKNFKTLRSIYDFGIVCPSFWGVHKDDQKVCEQGIGFKCLKHGCINPLLFPFYYYLFGMKHYFQKRRLRGYITATQLLKKYMENQGFKNIWAFPYFTTRPDNITPTYMGKNILFVGNLEENKGCESLIRAFAIVLKDVPDAKLTVVGSGLQETKLKDLSISLNIAKNINFAGSVPNEEITKYYLSSSLVVVPSLCMDNSPIVIYEALSFGKPVIATGRGGNPDLIQNGYNGFLVDANNPEELAAATVRILEVENQRFYLEIANNALLSSSRYDKGRYIDNLEMIYNKL